VVAHILSRFHIEVDIDEVRGETLDQARQRMTGVLEEKFFNISANLRRPEQAGLRFVRRR
jgi:hypothetical protein